MGQFVEAGPVIVDLLEKGGLRRHLHEIMGRDIKSLIAADAEIDAARRDHGVGDRHDLAFGQRRGIGGEAGAQPFALRDVEHGEAFEERDRFGVAALALDARFLAFGNEAVGIDHGRAMLALAHRAARLDGLLEGQPRLRRPALFDHRSPQDQDIDAAVIAAGQRVAREAGADASAAAPRLDPRDAARLQLGDDAARHLVIKVRAGFGGGIGRLGGSAHRVVSMSRPKTTRPPRKSGGWAAPSDQRGPNERAAAP